MSTGKFASENYEDIVARQDLARVFDNYTHGSFLGKRFFCHFDSDILQRRLQISSSEGFTFIKELTCALLELEGSESAALEEQYARNICHAFSGVYQCPNSMRRWTKNIGASCNDSEKSDSGSDLVHPDRDPMILDSDAWPLSPDNPFSEAESDEVLSDLSFESYERDNFSLKLSQIPVALLAAASAVVNLDLLKSLIICPDDIFGSAHWLGFLTPLEAAVASNKIELVQHIIEHAFPLAGRNFRGPMHLALCVAIRTSQNEIGNYIVDKILKNFEEDEEVVEQFSMEIRYCIDYSNSGLLPRLLPSTSEDVAEGEPGWRRGEATWVISNHDSFMQLYPGGRNIGGLVAVYGYDLIDRVINTLGIDPSPKLDKTLQYEHSYHTRAIR